MDVLWAPWRAGYIQGTEGAPAAGGTGCIFCDFPPAHGVPATEEGEERSRSLLVVHAREHAFVILNRFPYSNGHVLVVPRAHVADPSGLEDGAFRGLHDLLRDTVAAVRRAYRPEGLNVGMNLGRVAGAGIDAHIHYHVVPRWAGDTNFMPVLAGAKVVSEGLLDSYDKLKAVLG